MRRWERRGGESPQTNVRGQVSVSLNELYMLEAVAIERGCSISQVLSLALSIWLRDELPKIVEEIEK